MQKKNPSDYDDAVNILRIAIDRLLTMGCSVDHIKAIVNEAVWLEDWLRKQGI